MAKNKDKVKKSDDTKALKVENSLLKKAIKQALEDADSWRNKYMGTVEARNEELKETIKSLEAEISADCGYLARQG